MERLLLIMGITGRTRAGQPRCDCWHCGVLCSFQLPLSCCTRQCSILHFSSQVRHHLVQFLGGKRGKQAFRKRIGHFLRGTVNLTHVYADSFGVMMWACLYLVWNMYGRTTNEENRKLFRQGAVLLVAAISVWLFDSNFCFVYQYVPNPQLHAFWHVLVSYVSKGQAKRQTCPQPTLHTHTVETNTKNNNNIFLFFLASMSDEH
jgi:hypothetical protein